MQLSDVELIQGTIIDVADPNKLGRIKAIIPSIFENPDDKDCYPWIPPFGMTRYQSFSKEMEGAKVWIVQVRSNYNEYYYLPLLDPIQQTREFLNSKYEQNPEIVYLRDLAGQTAKITYDDQDGCMIQVKDTFVNVKTNNEVHCHVAGADVHIKDGSVYIGSDDDGGHEPAIFGNKLCTMLSNLRTAMSKLQTACGSGNDNPALASGFGEAVKALKDVDSLKCLKTNVN